jgi:hypothetical protein
MRRFFDDRASNAQLGRPYRATMRLDPCLPYHGAGDITLSVIGMSCSGVTCPRAFVPAQLLAARLRAWAPSDAENFSLFAGGGGVRGTAGVAPVGAPVPRQCCRGDPCGRPVAADDENPEKSRHETFYQSGHAARKAGDPSGATTRVAPTAATLENLPRPAFPTPSEPVVQAQGARTAAML